jgi:type IV fimbrial biogenesis protein FimT
VLEPLMAPQSRQRGLTVIELMTVLVVLAILAVLALPSFNNLMAKRRVEGVFGELHTDMQLARSEAVARNRAVRVTFGTGCYVVHVTSPATTTSCTQTTETIDPDDTKVKGAQLQAGTNAALVPLDSLTFVEFDPTRGTATWDGTGTSASVNVESSAGTWQLRSVAASLGRVRACSPNTSVEGFQAC